MSTAPAPPGGETPPGGATAPGGAPTGSGRVATDTLISSMAQPIIKEIGELQTQVQSKKLKKTDLFTFNYNGQEYQVSLYGSNEINSDTENRLKTLLNNKDRFLELLALAFPEVTLPPPSSSSSSSTAPAPAASIVPELDLDQGLLLKLNTDNLEFLYQKGTDTDRKTYPKPPSDDSNNIYLLIQRTLNPESAPSSSTADTPLASTTFTPTKTTFTIEDDDLVPFTKNLKFKKHPPPAPSS